MLKFIQQLKALHLQSLQDIAEDSEQFEHLVKKLSAIRLAEASLLKLQLNQLSPSYPLQIVILGPTQAGKSTLINFLTDSKSAGTSALAGFTVHAHAFTTGVKPDDTDWADILFEGFQRVSKDELNSSDYHQYTIESCEGNKLKKIAPCVLWDTPDFDSVHSKGYHSAVIRTLGLADILLLILSGEKYADKSVWRLLELALPLKKPLMVCINKIDSSSEQTILSSFVNRYSEFGEDILTPTLLGLPFVKGLHAGESQLPAKNRKVILGELMNLAKGLDRKQQKAHTYSFIKKHWNPWTDAVTAEHSALLTWKNMINAAVLNAKKHYQRDYLNHPEKYDTFKQTLAQLLILLEIPAIAEPLVKVRQVVTWPMRRLFNYGKRYTSWKSSEEATKTRAAMEQTVLNNICDGVLISLISQLNEQEASNTELSPWWQALSQQLFESKKDISTEFVSEMISYQEEFKVEIELAAQELYKNLENQPVTLNSLRAIRASAEATAVVLTVKSGGLSVNDIILAPAMLSITSMLTESAMGSYLDRIKAKLLRQQLDSVDKKLFAGYLHSSLLSLVQNRSSKDLAISQEELSAAEGTLRSLRA